VKILQTNSDLQEHHGVRAHYFGRTCSEAEWLKDFLFEFSIVLRLMLSISVHTDSRSTIEILKQENANKKMNRYIHIRLKSVQHLLDIIVILNFVKCEKNLTDPLTKGLFRSATLKSSREMG